MRTNWPKLWRGFVKSNYITALWNWFLGLAGKAAEPVLFASVLYSGYELVPGVPQPTPSINAVAFVIQQAALDVGGMGLIKLTKDEAPEKYRFARGIGIALITLMVVNMVVATAGRVFPVPSSIMQIIEGILLIVRSIFAVLFGHAIHTLKDETIDVLDLDIDAIVNQALAVEMTQLKTSFEEQIKLLQQRLEEVQSQSIIIETSTQEVHPVSTPSDDLSVTFEDTIEDTSSTPERLPERSVPAPKTEDKKSTPSVHQSVNNNGDTAKQIRKILKKKPDTGPTELAERIGCTKSYASRIKADWRKEQVIHSTPAKNGHSRNTQPLGELVDLEV